MVVTPSSIVPSTSLSSSVGSGHIVTASIATAAASSASLPLSSARASSSPILSNNSRTIEFRRGNLFDTLDVTNADIVIMETLIPDELGDELAHFLSTFKKGSLLHLSLTNQSIHC
jgi:hypothetical protein